jgi:hypothetical protein
MPGPAGIGHPEPPLVLREVDLRLDLEHVALELDAESFFSTPGISSTTVRASSVS